ncbi:hypothetical protein M404DRAFT_998448 [Pisolithus tinctorius Marx 270]|uniref:Uncharacterized protein n=1 Tax=Pisolithus tinctorius Marx 270 TaxID=870435 RepID=A0A0C3KBJ4_PISTI|nr:hypothetical protein M404DRAFT_998448 [Pisolithus tinctorius Marx 270]
MLPLSLECSTVFHLFELLQRSSARLCRVADRLQGGELYVTNEISHHDGFPFRYGLASIIDQ